MPITLPSSPTLDQTYTDGSNTWKWSGESWLTQPAENVAFNSLEAGTLDVTTSLTANALTANTLEVTSTLTVDSINVTGTSTGITVSQALNDLTDVQASSPSDGQVLKYISGTWQPASDLSGGGAGGGLGLTDLSVSVLDASGNGNLSYSNTTGTFSYTPADLSSYATQQYVADEIAAIGVTSAAGNTTEIQYNSGGEFAGSSFLTFNDVSGTLTSTSFSGTNVTATNVDSTTISATGLVDFTNTTTSTSATTGALVVTGGVGISGNLNIAGTTNTFTGSTTSTSINTGTIVVTGGVGISDNMTVGSNVSASTAPTQNEHLTNKQYVDAKIIAFSVAFGA